MQFNVASVASRTGIVTGVSALAVLAMFFAGHPQAEGAPTTHHWPRDLAAATVGDPDPSPDIFHHWPHLAPPTVASDNDDSPDIFHHWPHVAQMDATGDNDSSPDIFHHWPHAA